MHPVSSRNKKQVLLAVSVLIVLVQQKRSSQQDYPFPESNRVANDILHQNLIPLRVASLRVSQTQTDRRTSQSHSQQPTIRKEKVLLVLITYFC
jgi:hypothetical protein